MPINVLVMKGYYIVICISHGLSSDGRGRDDRDVVGGDFRSLGLSPNDGLNRLPSWFDTTQVNSGSGE